MAVLTNDNEDNAFISIRIIFNLLRNFRPTVEAEVQPFLDFVCSIYRNFPATVSHIFNSNSNPNASSSTGSTVTSPSLPPPPSSHLLGSRGDDGGGLDAPPGHGGIGGVVSPYSGTEQLNPSTRSFKIVTESPLVVMFLFQLYPKLVQTNIPYLLPLLVSSISITGPEKVSNNQKPQFVELKGAQVKTLSFLTYLLKTHADYIKPHEESICKSIVEFACNLSRLSPLERSDIRRGLFPLIDTLLDERVAVLSGASIPIPVSNISCLTAYLFSYIS